MTDRPTLLTSDELATELKVRRSTISKLRLNGTITPEINLGHIVRWDLKKTVAQMADKSLRVMVI